MHRPRHSSPKGVPDGPASTPALTRPNRRSLAPRLLFPSAVQPPPPPTSRRRNSRGLPPRHQHSVLSRSQPLEPDAKIPDKDLWVSSPKMAAPRKSVFQSPDARARLGRIINDFCRKSCNLIERLAGQDAQPPQDRARSPHARPFVCTWLLSQELHVECTQVSAIVHAWCIPQMSNINKSSKHVDHVR